MSVCLLVIATKSTTANLYIIIYLYRKLISKIVYDLRHFDLLLFMNNIGTYIMVLVGRE